jgi:alkane 1-monooxygenase
MNNIKAFKYYSPLIVYVLAFLSFTQTGLLCWLTLAYALVLIPLLELFWKPDETNMAGAEEEIIKQNKTYDYILYLIVALQLPTLFFFLNCMKQANLHWWDIIARTWTMGLLCGVFGINVGHELGHRANRFECFLAKTSLLTSLYMHFFIEHNKGHHKNVATKEDPSSARKGEIVYIFYFRTIVMSYINAWKIANADARKKHKQIFGLGNEMLQAHLVQLSFVVLIFVTFGWLITLYFLAAAAIGIGLVETVNYIEHYGLSRKEITQGKYERAMPQHSWNSNHVIGRLMLFELSRHSDHHYSASRKYQVLRHHDDAPQMPTGYPGMLLLATIPPLWFYVMHRQMKKYSIP